MSFEESLAGMVPLWRTLRQEGVTALVTPALDYVGGLELSGIDIRFASEGSLASVGEGLRSLVGSLDDDCTLFFLTQVLDENREAIEPMPPTRSWLRRACSPSTSPRGPSGLGSGPLAGRGSSSSYRTGQVWGHRGTRSE
jgi:hypothetical protein